MQYPDGPERAAAEKGGSKWCVQELEHKGRGVVSTSAITAGATVLLECRPLASVVHHSRTLQACATCMSLRLGEVSTKFLAQPIVCPVCAQACWCSEECRNQSTVAGAHPAQLCFAYKKLGEMAAAAQAKADADKGGDKAQSESDNVLLDEEALTDARLLFYAYLYRRYRPEEFHKWSLLCSPPEEDESEVFAAGAKKGNGASASSSAAAAVSPKSVLPPSPKTVAEEARIEQLHDVVVECLQYAADSIAAPTPNPATPAVATPPDAESDPLAMATLGSPPAAAAAAATIPAAAAPVLPVASPSSQLPPPPLALPRLAKQFTDLHISHPSDDLTSSLALDADLAVTRALYLKAQCNGFALAAPHDKLGNRQTPRGYALYTAAAMFNHSCMPNVARFDKIDCRDVKFVKKGAATTPAAAASSSSSSSSFSGGMSPTSPGAALPSPSASDCPSSAGFTPLALELRAMHAIPPYTELTLSYVPLFWERRDRRSHLRDEYAFRCRCARCRTEKSWEREEQEGEGEEEHEHDHDHDDEDEDDDDEEEGEDDDDGEGGSAPSDEESESDEEPADPSEDPLGRGELNVYCMKYICPSKTCGGTMAPIQAGSAAAATAPPLVAGPQGAALGGHMECNVCGKMRTDAQFAKQLQKEFGLRKK